VSSARKKVKNSGRIKGFDLTSRRYFDVKKWSKKIFIAVNFKEAIYFRNLLNI
jgi:hypothetical protein